MFNEIDDVLEELRSIPVEGECIEFKEAKKILILMTQESIFVH